MQTVQIRLPEEQLKKIDKEVKSGLYKSRSDAIRDYLSRIEFLKMFDDFQEIIDQENIDKKQLTVALSSARKKLYRKYL
jgi:Arc/MetJ-type ribon-helix-helix transcriptional regulator